EGSGDAWPFSLEYRNKSNGIQVLAAAYLALNQRGEGSSPSGPTEEGREARGEGRVHLDVGEPGSIRRLREPENAGSNPAIQTEREARSEGRETRHTEGQANGRWHPARNGARRKPLRVQLPLLPL